MLSLHDFIIYTLMATGAYLWVYGFNALLSLIVVKWGIEI